MRMIIIKKLLKLNVPMGELVQIYILYIRSIVEQYATVWHSSITVGEKNDLERTQKVALKIIVKIHIQVSMMHLNGLDCNS